jgi:orotidine-5'-phosphate decarboxylase
MYNMDKLYEAVSCRGPVCVGLDTLADYIPPAARRGAVSDAEAVLAYNQALIEATADIAACYKVQIACYEALGIAGLTAYAKTLKTLRDRGLLVIGDIKRGDIADTALSYAKAHFEGDFEADFVTLSPYMGMDAIEPWLRYADAKGKGAFVLLRTSNRGMRDFAYRKLQSGGRVYDAVGERLSALAAGRLGRYGYGAFGAVVGADPKTDAEREELAALRQNHPRLFLLIPGYGAQGGGAGDAALLLRDGNGGVVNASRSIIRAWQDASAEGLDPGAGIPYAAEAARRAVLAMGEALRAAGSPASSSPRPAEGAA